MVSISVGSSSFRRSASLAAALGVLGGATLVLFAAYFSAGKLLLPYVLFIVATGVVLKSSRVPTYGARCGVGLGAFLLASVGLYAFTAITTANGGLAAQVSAAGHLWRILVIVAVGAAIHAAVARVSD